MQHALFLFLSLLIIQGCSQNGDSGNHTPTVKSDTAALFPTERGEFENYAFVEDGKVIDQEVLSDYADDPAYFINGTQVSPYDIRWSMPEAYNGIRKSIRDTVIDGKRYKGSIHVDTDEDFFSDRITLAEAVEKYTGLPLQDIVVHWHSGNKADVSRLIQSRLSIYHIKPTGIRAVAIDSIRFAKRGKFVVHIADHGYRRGDLIDKGGQMRLGRWNNDKARRLFEEPLEVNTACPCYVADVNSEDQIFQRTELKPEPYKGKAVYLQKLSRAMGLPANKTAEPVIQDSIRVQFIVTRTGMLTRLGLIDADKLGDEDLLRAIKQYSCVWSLGMFSGRPVMTRRKMTIFYSTDPNGNIVSLDDLAYRYDK